MLKFKNSQGRVVSAVFLEDRPTFQSELSELGVTVATMRFPSAPSVTYLGHENPLSMFGRVVAPGQYVLVGEAGDFEVLTADQFDAEYAGATS